MKKPFHIFTYALLSGLICTSAGSDAQGIGVTQNTFTQNDRERMIRIEEHLIAQQKAIDNRFEAMQKQIDNRFEAMQKQIDNRFEAIDNRFEAMDNRFEAINTLIYFILGGVFGLIGLIFWDRRSYIKPVKEDIRELLNVLRAFAKKQPELADILRSQGLM